jgi:hypothetical protein
MRIAKPRADDPPAAAVTIGLECDLFDRDGEPSDQPRNLLQSLGIAIFDRLRKPDEAFVVAHRGHVARNNRRHGLHEIGLHEIAMKIGHRITSAESGSRGVAGE